MERVILVLAMLAGLHLILSFLRSVAEGMKVFLPLLKFEWVRWYDLGVFRDRGSRAGVARRSEPLML